jgi:butyryl-CoA dehydrogenase
MDFSLSDQQNHFEAQVRSLADRVCSATAADRDESASFPHEELKRMASEGLLSLGAPATSGGSGRDTISICLAIAAVSEADASIGLLIGFHNLVCDLLSRAASPEARDELLPGLLGRGGLAALALYERGPGGPGFEPAVVHPEEGGFRVSGAKPHVPGARGAEGFLVYARTADAGRAGRARSRVMLYVPRTTPGVVVEEPERIFGVRSSGACRVRFDDCRVPERWRLFAGAADPRDASRALLSSADLVVAAQAVGIGAAAFEKARVRAHQKGSDGETIGSRQSVQWKIADMATYLDAARLILLRAASAADRGELYAYEAAQAKVFAGRAAVRIAEGAMLIAGASGAITDFGVERHWRDAMTTEMNPSTRDETMLAVARTLVEENG